MKREERHQQVKDKAQNLFHTAQEYQRLVDRIFSHCRAINRMGRNDREKRQDERRDQLLSLDSRGVHLTDPIYQKLIRAGNGINGLYERSYIDSALARMGNRTMTGKEYSLINEVPEENLIGGWRLDERLENLNPKGTYDGPFGPRLPRMAGE